MCTCVHLVYVRVGKHRYTGVHMYVRVGKRNECAGENVNKFVTYVYFIYITINLIGIRNKAQQLHNKKEIMQLFFIYLR